MTLVGKEKKMRNKYYSLETSGDSADLYIFGDITSWPWDEKDKDAYSIVKELTGLTASSINVHINSYGGDVAEGLAIYNTLKNSSKKVTTYCDGFACSSASVIFMAGEERLMNEASLLMIHNAWTYASGDANAFRKQADDLDKITQGSVKAYMEKVNISEEELKALMDQETWVTAEEAVNWGFATGTVNFKEDGMNQSAMKSIRDRILGNTDTSGLLEARTADVVIDVEEIAEKVAEKVTVLLKRTEKSMKPEDSTGFGAFFNSRKGD